MPLSYADTWLLCHLIMHAVLSYLLHHIGLLAGRKG